MAQVKIGRHFLEDLSTLNAIGAANLKVANTS